MTRKIHRLAVLRKVHNRLIYTATWKLRIPECVICQAISGFTSGGFSLDSYNRSPACSRYRPVAFTLSSGRSTAGEASDPGEAPHHRGDLRAWTADWDAAGGAGLVAGRQASHLHGSWRVVGDRAWLGRCVCDSESRQVRFVQRGQRIGDGPRPSRALQDGQLPLGAGFGAPALRRKRSAMAL